MTSPGEMDRPNDPNQKERDPNDPEKRSDNRSDIGTGDSDEPGDQAAE